jgi:hypothetical protein
VAGRTIEGLAVDGRAITEVRISPVRVAPGEAEGTDDPPAGVAADRAAGEGPGVAAPSR